MSRKLTVLKNSPEENTAINEAIDRDEDTFVPSDEDWAVLYPGKTKSGKWTARSSKSGRFISEPGPKKALRKAATAKRSLKKRA